MGRADSAHQSLQVAGFGCIRHGRVLLRDIDLSLSAGQILRLQGSNGTGKSTLLRSLAGLMRWRAGSLNWCGQRLPAHHPDYQQQLAYLGHQCAMNETLTGWENLRFALQLCGLPWQSEQVQAVLAQLQVADVAQRPVGRMSQGQRRRMALARVLLSQRPLWLLDEPDNALDVQGCAMLGEVLARHAQVGGMAVVVSHRGIVLPAQAGKVLDLDAPTPSVCAAEAAKALV